MCKICKNIILIVVIGILVIGLGAFSSTSEVNNHQQGIEKAKLSFDKDSICIHDSDCECAKKSEATLKLEAVPLPTVDIKLVVDPSAKAMEEIEPRLEEIKNFIDKFKEKPVKMGLITLKPDPLTEDLEEIKKRLQEIVPEEEPVDLGIAMNEAIDELLLEGRPKAVKIMVIITAYQGNIARVMVPTWEAVEEEIKAFVVGVNEPNYAALRWIAQKTGGVFFPSNEYEEDFAKLFEAVFEEIKKRWEGEVAQDIEATVDFPNYATIQDVKSPCRIQTGKKVVCNIKPLKNGQIWEQTICEVDSEVKKDIELTKDDLTVDYTNPEGKQVEVEDHKKEVQTLEVPNHQPQADFELMLDEEDPDQFTPADNVNFVSQSKDCDGQIESCTWWIDVNKNCKQDGEDKVLSHKCKFHDSFGNLLCDEQQLGEQQIGLRVSDDNGGDKNAETDTACKMIEIKPILETEHESECFLPENFPPNKGTCKLLVHPDYRQFYTQAYTIKANTDIYGVEFEVEIPDDWEIDDSKLLPNCTENEGKITCLFKKIKRGEKKRISYDIRPPLDIEHCTTVSFTGQVSAIDPFLQPGESFKTKEIKVIKWLPLERAISCWNVEEAELDPEECRMNTDKEEKENLILISEDQKEQALAWWEKYVKEDIEEVVPGTNNETIGDKEMSHIIQCWKKKIPVNSCIQKLIQCSDQEEASKAEAKTACINQATSADLEIIDGIGSVTASNILEILPIKDWEELLEVKGIGEKLLESIKEQFALC